MYRTYPYSTGSRTGFLVKLSTKGYVIKTMEGQMNLGGLQNGMLETWAFSIRDKELYHKLEALEGMKLRLEYEEVHDSFFWMGDTNYFITGYQEKE
jgi:hypothetical protein